MFNCLYIDYNRRGITWHMQTLIVTHIFIENAMSDG